MASLPGKSMDYVEIDIFTSVNGNELSGLINETGFLGIWEDQDRIHVYWSTEHWDPEAKAIVLRAMADLGISDPEHHIRVNPIPRQDWNAQWGKLVEPVRIGKRFLIRPSWKASVDGRSLIELIIDPKQAFGTGHHTTTQLMIEMMEDIIVGKERVLDIGTGSGILGMAALRLGAGEALGIDTDPIAICDAQEYAFMNNIQEGLRFHVGTLKDLSPRSHDLILANLDRRTLLDLSKHLHRFAQPGCNLVVSGILDEHMAEVESAFSEWQWSLMKTRQRAEWAGMHFHHTASSLHGVARTGQASVPKIE